MPATPLPELETERLLLRQPASADLDDWATGIFADAEAMRYMPKRDLTPRARAERGLNNLTRFWTEHGVGAWAVTDKATGRFIGCCYVEPPGDSATGEPELGYELARAFWGQGLATEAARAAVRFTFEHNQVERVGAIVVPDNIGSWRVLEHLGFVYEKQAYLYDFDVKYYGLSRAQFQPGDHFYRVRVP